MPSRKIILAFCFICSASSASCGQQIVAPPPTPAADASRAQQPVPPPPKPADDGPSLEVTMKFIQDKLNDIGLLRWTVTAQIPDKARAINHAVELCTPDKSPKPF
jgi:hypothetical protein